ncbi:esterase-like activity of phytase family protein [Neomegalonema sp.]|uniref:esterase-like activity of phytase family protein n=1 Tax=Neomegalonema sp. TaxID=2039713 RepID=UPI002611B467|nr:esterase-like activity of phytase family protein [Neomegalonema sp.]MDD2869005.1 esterase-like activity of phytase family protein [Neomegalonema sp.]
MSAGGFTALGLAAALFWAGLAAAQEASPPASFEPLNLRAVPIPFDLRAPRAESAPRLKPMAAYALHSDHPRFGGLSSLAFGPEGALYAVTDVGGWIRFALEQDSAGRLTGVSGVVGDLSDGLGAFPKEDADAESLAFSPDGRSAYVGFERRHRIWRYDLTPEGAWPARAARAYAPPELRALTRNRGIESLGVLPDGALLALAENSRPGDAAIPAWILRGDEVAELSWRPRLREGFLPTDLDVGPDGWIYLLERRVSLTHGWAARVRRLPVAAVEPKVQMGAMVIADFSNRRQSLDNMEGLAVRFEGEGEARRLRLYLISDDNFLLFQRTLLLQFELEEAAP